MGGCPNQFSGILEVEMGREQANGREMQPPIGQGVEELGELSSFPRRLDSSEGLILGEMEDLLAEVLHRGIALRQIELAKIGLGNENEDLRFVPPAVDNPLEELLENLRIGQMNRGMLSHGNAPSGARSRGLSRT